MQCYPTSQALSIAKNNPIDLYSPDILSVPMIIGAKHAVNRTETMQLIINGEKREFAEPGKNRRFTVSELLTLLAVPSLKVAVELNRHIVAKSTYEQQSLQDGDQLEIVNFVGGG